eukprot:scaffold196373_cov18-Tisochrysis_lutea.AAC.1
MLLNPSLPQRHACLQHHRLRPLTCSTRQPLHRRVHASSTEPATAPAEVTSPLQHAPSFKAAIDFKGAVVATNQARSAANVSYSSPFSCPGCQAIKADLEGVEKNCKLRNSRANPRRAVELYDEYVRLKLEADTLRA